MFWFSYKLLFIHPTPVVSTFLPCDLSDLSQMYREHPTDCQLFYQCAPGEHGAELVEKSCGPHTMYNPITKVCDFASSVIDIRPECLCKILRIFIKK